MNPQKPRGARADAIRDGTAYLFKAVSTLQLTYQIRLLTFFAVESGQQLVISVPSHCEILPPLKAHVCKYSKNLSIERAD